MPKNLIFLSLNAEFKQDEKIKISPVGEFEGIDGRRYSLNADLVLKNSQKMSVDLMLDKNHEDDEAMGWFDINSLEKRDDGIFASLTLTPKGEELVKNRSYRYLSPAYVIEAFKENGLMVIERIASVGLVNRPNLLSQALNNDETKTKGENMEKELAELKAQLVALKAENEALQAKVKELEAEKEKQEEEANKIAQNAKIELIDKAIENKELLPKRKETALALNGQALTDFLDTAKAEAQAELATNSAEKLNAPKSEEPIDESVKAQLGLD